MKIITAALFSTLIGTAAAESCPDSLPGRVELDGAGLALSYGILETEQAFCGKLESNTEAWVGFGVQPEGVNQMIGAHAIIALPLADTVQQYTLNSKSNSGIALTESQSLTGNVVAQEGGVTVAIFKQPLSGNGLALTSQNVYLLAKGRSNDLGYHARRGFVTLDFESNIISSSTTTTEAPGTPMTDAPMTDVIGTLDFQSNIISSSTTTTEAPDTSMTDGTPMATSSAEASSISTTSATEEASTATNFPTAAPPVSTPAPSSASLQKIGSMVFGGSLLLIAVLTI
eukprot:CAMPEP_0201688050 /NCGR_PEP_ID=MMETSP0578-20130828/1824_1 /ASSEMBLY_ACC=CAM_ASM_000663 /TAXON_ID=267565 /ORGANISM="Skeletonema grethea, Strain CCMP 1804" /LENGTH=285 /DNA_ID=CAMNT_0048172241 /DNA_START=172 /DNA_END=1029 /DNA_ORIENTATION=+